MLSERFENRFDAYCFNESGFKKAIKELENPAEISPESKLTKSKIEEKMGKSQLFEPCTGFYATLQENIRGAQEVACEYRGLPLYGYGKMSDKSGIKGKYQFDAFNGNISHAGSEQSIIWDEETINTALPNNLADWGMSKVITINADEEGDDFRRAEFTLTEILPPIVEEVEVVYDGYNADSGRTAIPKGTIATRDEGAVNPNGPKIYYKTKSGKEFSSFPRRSEVVAQLTQFPSTGGVDAKRTGWL